MTTLQYNITLTSTDGGFFVRVIYPGDARAALLAVALLLVVVRVKLHLLRERTSHLRDKLHYLTHFKFRVYFVYQ